MDNLFRKSNKRVIVVTIGIVLMTTSLACSLANSVIEGAIARTEAAQPTSTATTTPTVVPTDTPTLIPSFTPVVDPTATETPLPDNNDTVFNSLQDAIVTNDQLSFWFEGIPLTGLEDLDKTDMDVLCEIDCAGQIMSYEEDFLWIIIMLSQHESEQMARSIVDEYNAIYTEQGLSEFPLTSPGEYETFQAEFTALMEEAMVLQELDFSVTFPDNVVLGYVDNPDVIEGYIFGSYGPISMHITVVATDFWGYESAGHTLLTVMMLQTQNLMKMSFN